MLHQSLLVTYARSPRCHAESQGNQISNLDDVQSLTGLQCLRHLQLQIAERDARNPVCEHPAYRAAMRRMLPRLQSLDGQRTVLVDATPPDDANSVLSGMAFPEPEPWLKDFDTNLSVPAATSPGEALQGSKDFDAIMVECSRLSARALTLVEDFKCRTPRRAEG